jgi:hypothetical protein
MNMVPLNGAKLVGVLHEVVTGYADGTKTLHRIQYTFETNTNLNVCAKSGLIKQDATLFQKRFQSGQAKEAA